jgi:hypothetical protein
MGGAFFFAPDIIAGRATFFFHRPRVDENDDFDENAFAAVGGVVVIIVFEKCSSSSRRWFRTLPLPLRR